MVKDYDWRNFEVGGNLPSSNKLTNPKARETGA